MATKTKTQKNRSLNESLLNATKATINATVENGEKWQKLTKKLIKKSEPVRRKQMDLVFNTASAVKTQVTTGAEKMMDLVGFEQAVEYAKNNPVSKKVMEVSDKVAVASDNLKSKVAESPVVQKVGQTAETVKTKGTAKLNDIKEDVLEQAQKILNKGEEMVEGALTTTKAAPAKKAPAKRKPAAKKATTAKATAVKATTAKAATAKATPAKKTTAAKRTTAAPKAAAKKTTTVKKTTAKVEAPVAAKATETK